MKRIRWFAIGILAVWAGTTVAQSLGNGAGQPPAPEPIPQIRPLLSRIGPFDVQDMPLSEFCRELQDRLGDHVVIFVDNDIAGRPVSLTIPDIDAFSVFNLLQSVADVNVTWSSSKGFVPVRSLFDMNANNFARAMPGNGPILLRVEDNAPARPAISAGVAPGDVSTRVYNISSILQGDNITVDDIATAVRTAWPEGDPSLQLRVHEDTGLLICRGRADALDVVDQILFQLKGGEDAVTTSMMVRGGGIPPEWRETTRRNEDLQRALETTHQELADRERRNFELSKRFEEESRDRAEELAKTQLELAHARQEWELENKSKMMDRELEFRAQRVESTTRIESLEKELEQVRGRLADTEARNQALQQKLMEAAR